MINYITTQNIAAKILIHIILHIKSSRTKREGYRNLSSSNFTMPNIPPYSYLQRYKMPETTQPETVGSARLNIHPIAMIQKHN